MAELFSNVDRLHLLDMLNIHCPGCQQVFDDFSGCCTVTCVHCNVTFCGFCMMKHVDYTHVCNCPKNPHPKDAGSVVIFHTIRRQENRLALIDELKAIENTETRRALFNMLTKDLADRQIIITAAEILL